MSFLAHHLQFLLLTHILPSKIVRKKNVVHHDHVRNGVGGAGAWGSLSQKLVNLMAVLHFWAELSRVILLRSAFDVCVYSYHSCYCLLFLPNVEKCPKEVGSATLRYSSSGVCFSFCSHFHVFLFTISSSSRSLSLSPLPPSLSLMSFQEQCIQGLLYMFFPQHFCRLLLLLNYQLHGILWYST